MSLKEDLKLVSQRVVYLSRWGRLDGVWDFSVTQAGDEGIKVWVF